MSDIIPRNVSDLLIDLYGLCGEGEIGGNVRNEYDYRYDEEADAERHAEEDEHNCRPEYHELKRHFFQQIREERRVDRRHDAFLYHFAAARLVAGPVPSNHYYVTHYFCQLFLFVIAGSSLKKSSTLAKQCQHRRLVDRRTFDGNPRAREVMFTFRTAARLGWDDLWECRDSGR